MRLLKAAKLTKQWGEGKSYPCQFITICNFGLTSIGGRKYTFLVKGGADNCPLFLLRNFQPLYLYNVFEQIEFFIPR